MITSLLLQVFIQALGEGFDQFVFVEKFLEDDAQYRVGRDGKYHAGDARHAAGKQQDNENFQRMGMDAITVYKRLEQGIVYQAGNEHGYRHAYQERQHLGVEVHVKIEDNAHGQTKQDADEGTNVRNNIQDSRDQGNDNSIVEVQTDNGEPQRVERHDPYDFKEQTNKVAHQEFLNGVKGIAGLLFITRRHNRQHHF